MRLIITNIKQLRLKYTLMWLGIISLATVLVWIGYSIYSSYNRNTVDPKVTQLRQALNPAIDSDTLNTLTDRLVLPDTFTILTKASPLPGQLESQTGTASGSSRVGSGIGIPRVTPTPRPATPIPAATPTPTPDTNIGTLSAEDELPPTPTPTPEDEGGGEAI